MGLRQLVIKWKKKRKIKLKQALCTAEKTVPVPVDYKKQTMRFKDALDKLKDPSVSAEVKNRYLKDIIERIEYNRVAAIRICHKNKHLYMEEWEQGLMYHNEPFELSIKLRV